MSISATMKHFLPLLHTTDHSFVYTHLKNKETYEMTKCTSWHYSFNVSLDCPKNILQSWTNMRFSGATWVFVRKPKMLIRGFRCKCNFFITDYSNFHITSNQNLNWLTKINAIWYHFQITNISLPRPIILMEEKEMTRLVNKKMFTSLGK